MDPITFSISPAETSDSIVRCFAVMRELRPALSAEEFLIKVQRQQRDDGYQLVFLEADGEIRAVAGYRIASYLAWGRLLYVDDLATRAADQGRGFGSALFDWLIEKALSEKCQEFHLDSGVQRFAAHRFYLHKGMDITAHHFALRL